MHRTSLSPPTERVLDLFAVPGSAEPLSDGSARSWRAGDLVLTPGRTAQTQDWLSPLLARLAVELDERPGRRSRDLRLAMPVPARNGSWVVDGWAASRFEPGTSTCRELAVNVAAGRLLHAELSVAVPRRPEQLPVSGEERPLPAASGRTRALVTAVHRQLDAEPGWRDLGPDQLVHADLAGNVLLDPQGAPVVIDFAPLWRPVVWAEAVLVLDSVLTGDAEISVLTNWARGRERQAMLHAINHRLLGDPEGATDPYERTLAVISQ